MHVSINNIEQQQNATIDFFMPRPPNRSALGARPARPHAGGTPALPVCFSLKRFQRSLSAFVALALPLVSGLPERNQRAGCDERSCQMELIVQSPDDGSA
jgi:hypothetical protein